MISLIDGDIIAYRNAAATGDDSVEFALIGCDRMIQNILQVTEADSYKIFLSGSGNFRYDINPDYKANRKDIVRPQHLQACREFLIDNYNAQLCHGFEADDMLGIEQDKRGTRFGRLDDAYSPTNLEIHTIYDTVICSIDKDLLQIPGYHYNFVKNEFKTVDPIEGIRHFYKQMLIGDRADNLFGVDKIGPVKAGKLLDHITSEKEMMKIVCTLYNDADRFQMNADCFWVMHQLGEMWTDRVIP